MFKVNRLGNPAPVGHAADGSGLQNHSIGLLFPWHIVGSIVDDKTCYYGRNAAGQPVTQKYFDQRFAIKWTLIDKWETEGHTYGPELRYRAWLEAQSCNY